MTAPDGTRYLVRVLRNLPFRRTPLGPLGNLLPQHITLPVLVAANVYAHGQTGWSVQVLRAETAWRAERVIFTQRVRGGSDVADVAIGLAQAVHTGGRLRPESTARDVWRKLLKVMNRE